MKNKLPIDEVEEHVLRAFRAVYGQDVLSFKFKGSETVEMMAMAYRMGLENAPKEKK